MSGHNKWSTIKRKKGALDAKRSKIFSKIIKDITIAVKESGSDPEHNPRLRLAIANAKGASMPKETITRAINKGSEKDAATLMETTYEGKGPQGIAIFVEATTDNVQRTVSNIRAYFNKHRLIRSRGIYCNISIQVRREACIPIASIRPVSINHSNPLTGLYQRQDSQCGSRRRNRLFAFVRYNTSVFVTIHRRLDIGNSENMLSSIKAIIWSRAA